MAFIGHLVLSYSHKCFANYLVMNIL